MVKDISDDELNYLRNEVQKIINNHLKEWDNFSVANYNYQEIMLLIDLLSWELSIEQLEKMHKNNQLELKKNYELIICESDYFNSIKNRYNEWRATLSWLKEDITLDSKLNELDNL